MLALVSLAGLTILIGLVIRNGFRDLQKVNATLGALDERPLLIALDDVDFDWPEYLS